ncbi:MAG: TraB/GumN family protein [Chitinophagaceae bacterium]|nr:TraB/GumN family protein [Chitinophagaceae bacterium]
MKKILFLILSLLAGSVQAQQKVNSLLWKISREGMPDSYLFGTMHAMCKEDYQEPEKLAELFAQCSQLILETDLSDTKSFGEMMLVVELKEDTTLRWYIPNDDDYLEIKSGCEANGIELDEYMRFKPMLLISMLSMKNFSCTDVESFEANLMKMAQRDKKSIFGLESALYQLQLFDQLSREDILEMIKSALQELSNKDQHDQMTTLYKNRDVEGLYDLISRSSEMKDHRDLFLHQRNKNWVNQLPDILKEVPSFIAVGAGHLGGPQGVIALLRAKGFKVEPVL